MENIMVYTFWSWKNVLLFEWFSDPTAHTYNVQYIFAVPYWVVAFFSPASCYVPPPNCHWLQHIKCPYFWDLFTLLLIWTWPLLNQQTFLFHDFSTMHASQDFNPYGNPVPLGPLLMIFLLGARSHTSPNHLSSSGVVILGSFYSTFVCECQHFNMFLNGLPPFYGLFNITLWFCLNI